MRKEYIMLVPPLSKSNGVKTLYLLYIHLTKRGEKVRLCAPGIHVPGFNYITPEEFTEDITNNAIVIYPEIVIGNPLDIRNVVRYVLYYPGVLGGTKEYHPSEFIVTHNPMFYTGAFKLTIPWIDKALFYDNNSPKTQDCYFVHKGGKFREVPELEGLTEINMHYPKTKQELANLLRTTGTLYSFDDCSSLVTEAMLCGAKVKIITEDGFIDQPNIYNDFVSDFEEQMEKFIQVTQELNYTGPTENEMIKETDENGNIVWKIKEAVS